MRFDNRVAAEEELWRMGVELIMHARWRSFVSWFLAGGPLSLDYWLEALCLSIISWRPFVSWSLAKGVLSGVFLCLDYWPDACALEDFCPFIIS